MFEETGGIRMGITYGNCFFARPNKKVPKRPKRHLENLEKKHNRSSTCLSLKKGVAMTTPRPNVAKQDIPSSHPSGLPGTSMGPQTKIVISRNMGV
jgi:hypothetical protein